MYILPFTSLLADLPTVGGKGANLCRLAQAGLPVPPGYFVTTQAYRDFVAANRLEAPLSTILTRSDPADPASLERASAEIRALFRQGAVPALVEAALLDAYAQLSEPAVAVRSSATAEDLPEMSFAGQQDTFLNVMGEAALLRVVVDCWSSLWTARAIGYRCRNGVPHADAALGVVVQRMVESQAAGVLFTANPLSGLRTETVIDAALGLGEALVSGLVEPDHYTVDPAQGRILSVTLGAKVLSIHAQAGGGTHRVEQARAGLQALPDAQILELARLGQQVEALFGCPQDIEWAWDGEKLHLLQARPVTGLYPLPAGMPAEPLQVFSSFAAVQGLFDPITPLGRAAICQLAAAAAGLFGVQVTARTQQALFIAGERLWANITPIVRNSLGRKIAPVVLSAVEPTMRQAMLQILPDPRLQPERKGLRPATLLKLARFLRPVMGNILLNLASPARRREQIVEGGERLLAQTRARCAAIQGSRSERLAQAASLFPDLIHQSLPLVFRRFVSLVASAMISWMRLNKLAEAAARHQPPEVLQKVYDLELHVTRGMPFNPTTEMDLKLWALAKGLRRDPASLQALGAQPAAELAARYHASALPEPLMQAAGSFLALYGERGLGEIDLGRPRWNAEPAPVFVMLASFVQIDDEARAPDVMFAQGAASAEAAVAELVAIVRAAPHGWLKARLARFFAGRVRQLMGGRESPKFFAVRMMGVIQRAVLDVGQDMAQAGELSAADDLFYLDFYELAALAAGEACPEGASWQALMDSRRAAYRRELLRRQVPRLLLSDGRAFYEGLSAPESAAGAAHLLHGSPVSPGSVEGRVRVVFDPRQAGLLPGEILVCPGTDPSWTPLFLTAGGLVLETGGMMTHGAVVAREYGIPAVVGVDRATQRLRTGSLVRLDGSTGEIHLLDEA
jgi:pyruvate,water dikinase